MKRKILLFCRRKRDNFMNIDPAVNIREVWILFF